MIGGEEEILGLPLSSPYNPIGNTQVNNTSGSVIIRKRSGTSHAQKSSLKVNGLQDEYQS